MLDTWRRAHFPLGDIHFGFETITYIDNRDYGWKPSVDIRIQRRLIRMAGADFESFQWIAPDMQRFFIRYLDFVAYSTHNHHGGAQATTT